MENPDVELDLERNELGLVTKMSYKAGNPGEDNIRAAEFCSLAAEMLRSEGPEDHSTVIDVDARMGD